MSRGSLRSSGHHAIDELGLGGDRVRQEALQAQAQTLRPREGDGLVARLVAQEIDGLFRHIAVEVQYRDRRRSMPGARDRRQAPSVSGVNSGSYFLAAVMRHSSHVS